MSSPRDSDAALIEALDSFVASRSALEDTVVFMRDRQTAELVAAKARRKRNLIVGTILAVVIVAALYGAFHSLTNAGDARARTLSGVESVAGTLNDCLTAGPADHPHRCYTDSNAKTAAILEAFKAVQIKAAAYAVECVIAGRADVEQCVGERFAGAPRPIPATTPAPPTGMTTTTITARSRGNASPVTTNTGTTVPRTSSTTTTVPVISTTAPTVQPCQLDIKVFCITQPSSPCTTVAVACLPAVNPKGP